MSKEQTQDTAAVSDGINSENRLAIGQVTQKLNDPEAAPSVFQVRVAPWAASARRLAILESITR